MFGLYHVLSPLVQNLTTPPKLWYGGSNNEIIFFMPSILTQRLQYQYNQEIDKIVNVLKNKYGPSRIILYGSAASGRLNRDSDIDLLIIKNTPLKRRERIRQVSDLFLERRIPFDPMILTEAEVSIAARNNPVVKNIINSGKILYDRAGIKTN